MKYLLPKFFFSIFNIDYYTKMFGMVYTEILILNGLYRYFVKQRYVFFIYHDISVL